ncbi:unnamed protein product [Caenorhabditis angaria]|uniref:Uncharacterized protein n=1 Tax=Caenorhabditis angaria TaxID=860376 RepID=A0A9P1MTN4_9PELO|nr:unnamed protein product [Caenorhabditis angaria]
MLSYLVFLALLLPIQAAVNSTICQEYIDVNNQFNCGENGYPLHYGYKNCMAFTNPENRDRFDEAGKAWIDCTAPCLVAAFANIAQTSTTCSELQTKAFASHVDCYLNCGFCSVCQANKLAFAETFDWADFLNLNSVIQVWQISRKCPNIFSCLA